MTRWAFIVDYLICTLLASKSSASFDSLEKRREDMFEIPHLVTRFVTLLVSQLPT